MRTRTGTPPDTDFKCQSASSFGLCAVIFWFPFLFSTADNKRGIKKSQQWWNEKWTGAIASSTHIHTGSLDHLSSDCPLIQKVFSDRGTRASSSIHVIVFRLQVIRYLLFHFMMKCGRIRANLKLNQHTKTVNCNKTEMTPDEQYSCHRDKTSDITLTTGQNDGCVASTANGHSPLSLSLSSF